MSHPIGKRAPKQAQGMMPSAVNGKRKEFRNEAPKRYKNMAGEQLVPGAVSTENYLQQEEKMY